MSRRIWFGLILFVAVLAVAHMAAAADNSSAIVNGIDQSTKNNNGWLVQHMAGNFLYAMVSWVEIGLTLTWLAVTWAVIELYKLMGNYIVPIWDFSNDSGFFKSTESVAASIVHVSPAASALFKMPVPWLVGLCIVMMTAILSSIAVPKSILNDRDPWEGVSGLIWAGGLMLVYPVLYSAPIHLGNAIARELRVNSIQWTDTAYNQNGQTGLFDALLTSTIFPNSQGTGVLGTASNLVGSAVSGISSGIGMASTNPSLAASTAAQGIQSNVTSYGTMAITTTAALSSSAQSILSDIFTGGADGNGIQRSIDTSRQMAGMYLETLASRFIQIVLAVWGIIELVGVLILKGTQIIALMLNYYLGWIACALYVLPQTRAVFFAWLRTHITLCLWGLIWALLMFIMDVIVLAGNSLQGMSPCLGNCGPGMIYAGVGQFLMPFLMFAAIHKFKDVGKIADSLSSTSALAQQVAGGIRAGFMEGISSKGPMPGFISSAAQVGGGSGGVGSAIAGAGSAWANGMTGIASKAATGLNFVAPGLGTAVAGGMQAVGGGVRMASSAAGAASGNLNPFKLRAMLASKQRTPPPPAAEVPAPAPKPVSSLALLPPGM